MGGIDMVGQRFGMIEVIERSPANERGDAMWLCRCDCGTEKSWRGIALRALKPAGISCGCVDLNPRQTGVRHAKDVTGLRWGMLVAVELIEVRDGGHAYWRFNCDCGGSHVAAAANVKRGHIRSCGCIQGERKAAAAARRAMPRKPRNSTRTIDETGNQYGRWTVVEQAPRDHRRIALWSCECACGTVRTVSGDTLRSGRSKSCGTAGCVVRPCSIEGCEKPIQWGGMCSMHATRKLRGWDPDRLIEMPAAPRTQVELTEPGTECMIWPGQLTDRGYGPYRRIYEKLREPVPADMQLDHRCRVLACVNPNHLEVVTVKENIRRRVIAQDHIKLHGDMTGAEWMTFFDNKER